VKRDKNNLLYIYVLGLKVLAFQRCSVTTEEMHKCVHRSLNLGESYHQLRSAISKVSGKKLIGETEMELIWFFILLIKN
jgi:hypothetical protein